MTTISSMITPDDKFLRDVFNRQKSYYIDIYQREYKWTEDNVNILLNDIELRFGVGALKKTNPEDIQKDVKENFEPYFLNTYLTHSSTGGNISIVDGQQRLTTLLLIFIKLYHIIKEIEESGDYQTKTYSSQTIEQLIYGKDDFGNADKFKIHNLNRAKVLAALVEKTNFEPADETQQKILDNYSCIEKYFDSNMRLSDENADKYDINRVTYYITYLLDRISIVEIRIEEQNNVAMIFEVVNDRGLGLKPYEILKGKLIGRLNGDKKEEANKTWTGLQDQYFKTRIKHSTEATLDLDNFFRTFLRAKFADSEAEYEKFEGDYHFELYRNDRLRQYFADFNDNSKLYSIITNEIKYFAELYLKIRTSYEYDYLIYNKLLDQNQQYLLIMSNIKINDSKEEEKIISIAKKFDQMHTTLRLLDAYDSNPFQRIVYRLVPKVRNMSIADAERALDEACLGFLVNSEVIPDNTFTTIEELYTFDRFKNIRNKDRNFSKYILMRVDRLLGQILDKPAYTNEVLEKLEERFNKNNRRRYGMHLEHIYAYNDENMQLFSDPNGVFDEQKFNRVRNQLGMLLLLKDSQNISSNNDLYNDKIEDYKTSNIIWNELLTGAIPNVDQKNLPACGRITQIQPDTQNRFPIDKVDLRQEELYRVIDQIWGAGYK